MELLEVVVVVVAVIVLTVKIAANMDIATTETHIYTLEQGRFWHMLGNVLCSYRHLYF